ncbi:MAG: hypothetical protein GAK28_01951 [Luteibacter sp.]|uniref:EamA family transporter n=1 Tax=Luteibacter sp. TaxID=1886636 RepID=UPI0013809961|nr:EamA family transporter [Luteibacter sp.]KAF1007312.1 MAG: hypothetical protein GAK28_01951 [Luteibacter sp.]
MFVFAVVLLGALLHATWNLIVKRGGDAMLSAVLVGASGAVIAAVALPFLPPPASPSWPFIALSSVLQTAYFFLLARSYQLADMSQVYPVMRGTAPLLVTMANLALPHGDPLTLGAFAGIALICSGVLGVAFGQTQDARGLRFAFLNAFVIAGYTIVDGMGVRRADSPLGYTLWPFLISGVALALWALATRGKALLVYARTHLALATVGGLGSITSYGLALWAMTRAPIPVIAALRETSIVFGTFLAWAVLRERVGRRRMVAVSLIVAGAAMLKLA